TAESAMRIMGHPRRSSLTDPTSRVSGGPHSPIVLRLTSAARTLRAVDSGRAVPGFEPRSPVPLLGSTTSSAVRLTPKLKAMSCVAERFVTPWPAAAGIPPPMHIPLGESDGPWGPWSTGIDTNDLHHFVRGLT